MSSRSYVKISYGRLLDPHENPTSIDSLEDFKLKSKVSKQNANEKILLRPLKHILSHHDDVLSEQNQPNQSNHYYFTTVEGGYTPMNSYIQPSVSGNYVIPHGSMYFDERLTLDYIDKAVRDTENNAFWSQIFAQSANNASRDAHFDADKTGHLLDNIMIHSHNIRKS